MLLHRKIANNNMRKLCLQKMLKKVFPFELSHVKLFINMSVWVHFH